MRALFTAMERGVTFRAITLHIKAGLQCCGTVITSGRCHRLYQPGKAWPGYVQRRTRSLRARFLVAVLVAVLARRAGFLVSARFVFAISVHGFLNVLLWEDRTLCVGEANEIRDLLTDFLSERARGTPSRIKFHPGNRMQAFSVVRKFGWPCDVCNTIANQSERILVPGGSNRYGEPFVSRLNRFPPKLPCTTETVQIATPFFSSRLDLGGPGSLATDVL